MASHDEDPLTQPDDTFVILLATDNHVGYMEKDPVRSMDSLRTFEEILRIAQAYNVDFVLLGGDLFHENKPSRKIMVCMMELLREYCMGDRPCPIQFLSDPSVNFSNKFATVNYMDPNLNISMPVFSIHGNHDDPSGDGNFCALDMLSVSGLVNYFGRSRDLDDVVVSPILLAKGNTRLAIYGLGNIRDERLHRNFLSNKVTFQRPEEDPDSWFNLCVLHQNRVKHGAKNYIPETFLGNFLHLVLWGHEHECLLAVDPGGSAEVPERDFHISQPGSSVATSLSEGEAREKHVAILRIKGDGYKIQPIPLKTVRPFLNDEVALKDVPGLRPSDEKAVVAFLASRVKAMITKADADWKARNPEDESPPPLPLIRLKVEYSGGFSVFNTLRFGQQFVNQVANPKDIILFYVKKAAYTVDRDKKKAASSTNTIPAFPEQVESVKVEDLVQEYLSRQNLDVLPENELGDAVRTFVEKEDKDAIKEFLKGSLDLTRDKLKSKKDSPILMDEIARLAKLEKQVRVDAWEQFHSQTSSVVSSARRKKADQAAIEETHETHAGHRSNNNEDDEPRQTTYEGDNHMDTEPPSTTRGSARSAAAASSSISSSSSSSRRGRTAAATASSLRQGNKSRKENADDDGDDDDDDNNDDDNNGHDDGGDDDDDGDGDDDDNDDDNDYDAKGKKVARGSSTRGKTAAARVRGGARGKMPASKSQGSSRGAAAPAKSTRSAAKGAPTALSSSSSSSRGGTGRSKAAAKNAHDFDDFDEDADADNHGDRDADERESSSTAASATSRGRRATSRKNDNEDDQDGLIERMDVFSAGSASRTTNANKPAAPSASLASSSVPAEAVGKGKRDISALFAPPAASSKRRSGESSQNAHVIDDDDDDANNAVGSQTQVLPKDRTAEGSHTSDLKRKKPPAGGVGSVQTKLNFSQTQALDLEEDEFDDSKTAKNASSSRKRTKR